MSDEIEMRRIVADVAAAYFNNSHVAGSEIPYIINQIASSLLAVGAPQVEEPKAEEAEPEAPKLTASQIKKSITRDAIISFEDNKPYKTLRRHLAVRGLTPEQYRAKWGLPANYPMVAPAYSEARASMARSIGLGTRIAAQAAAPEPRTAQRAEPAAEPPAQETAPAKKPAARGRPKTAAGAPRRGRRPKAAETPPAE